MVNLIALYILFYSISMFIHEYGHMLGAALQGVKSRIEYVPYKGLPSYRIYPLTGIKRDKLFDVMGGVFSGVILLSIMGLIINTNATDLIFTLASLSILQLTYGIYEMSFLRKWSFEKYMKWHYVLYGTIIGLSFLMYKVFLN